MTSDDWITSTPEGVDRIIDGYLEAPDDDYTDQDGTYPRPTSDVLEATRVIGKTILDGIADEVDITPDVLGGMAVYYGSDWIGIMNCGSYHICRRVFEEESQFFHYDKLEDLLEGVKSGQ